MPVLLKLRAIDLGPDADGEIDATRARVVAMLSPDAADEAPTAPQERESFHGLHGDGAREILARRLAHIEHAARKVTRLSARPVLEQF
jgi:hypothetical protein